MLFVLVFDVERWMMGALVNVQGNEFGPVTGMALLTPHLEWSWNNIVKEADAELLAQLEYCSRISD